MRTRSKIYKNYTEMREELNNKSNYYIEKKTI